MRRTSGLTAWSPTRLRPRLLVSTRRFQRAPRDGGPICRGPYPRARSSHTSCRSQNPARTCSADDRGRGMPPLAGPQRRIIVYDNSPEAAVRAGSCCAIGAERVAILDGASAKWSDGASGRGRRSHASGSEFRRAVARRGRGQVEVTRVGSRDEPGRARSRAANPTAPRVAPGHIPDSPTAVGRALQRRMAVKSPAELREAFTAAGVDPEAVRRQLGWESPNSLIFVREIVGNATRGCRRKLSEWGADTTVKVVGQHDTSG